jgi:hypothetical protein
MPKNTNNGHAASLIEIEVAELELARSGAIGELYSEAKAKLLWTNSKYLNCQLAPEPETWIDLGKL